MRTGLRIMLLCSVMSGTCFGQQPKERHWVGVAACVSAGCHGSNGTERNQYSIWVQRDKHAVSYLTLLTPLSESITKRLGLGPAVKEQSCVGCHAPAPNQTHARFGISCETCHGAASDWIEPHKKSDWNTNNKSELGMVNLRSANARSNLCSGCHVGRSGFDVNHDLIAAGHPRLIFELDTYLANMPKHWAEESATSAPGNWVIGQLGALKRAQELFAYRVEQTWPEFAEFDCTGCHHDLGGNHDDAARLSIGSVLWNRSQWDIAKHFLKEDSAQLELTRQMSRLRVLVTRPETDAVALKTALVPIDRSLDQLNEGGVELRSSVRVGIEAVAAEFGAEHVDFSEACQISMLLSAVRDDLTPAQQSIAAELQEATLSDRRFNSAEYREKLLRLGGGASLLRP